MAVKLWATHTPLPPTEKVAGSPYEYVTKLDYLDLRAKLAVAQGEANEGIGTCAEVEQIAAKALGYKLLEPDGKTLCIGAHVPQSIVSELAGQLAETEDDLRISCGDVALKTEEMDRLRRELAAAQKRANQKMAEAAVERAEKILATERAEKAERAAGNLTDRLDLAHDEFKRIASCPGADSEIKQLCERGQMDIRQHVSVIVQRDKAETNYDTALDAWQGELHLRQKAERIIAALEGEACVEAAVDAVLTGFQESGFSPKPKDWLPRGIQAALAKAKELAEAE